MTPETITLLICTGLAFVASFAKAVADTLQHHFDSSIFQDLDRAYWDPRMSWTAKYHLGLPDRGPRFFLSTTWLVWLTDAWHLAESLKRSQAVLLLVLLWQAPQRAWLGDLSWYGVLIALAVNYSTFHLAYHYILPRKKQETVPEMEVELTDEQGTEKSVGKTRALVLGSTIWDKLNDLGWIGSILVLLVPFGIGAALGLWVNPYLGAAVVGICILAMALAQPIYDWRKKHR